MSEGASERGEWLTDLARHPPRPDEIVRGFEVRYGGSGCDKHNYKVFFDFTEFQKSEVTHLRAGARVRPGARDLGLAYGCRVQPARLGRWTLGLTSGLIGSGAAR